MICLLEWQRRIQAHISKLAPKAGHPLATVRNRTKMTQTNSLSIKIASSLPLPTLLSRRPVLVSPLQHPLSNLPPILRILPDKLRLAVLALAGPLTSRLRRPLRWAWKQHSRRARFRSLLSLRPGSFTLARQRLRSSTPDRPRRRCCPAIFPLRTRRKWSRGSPSVVSRHAQAQAVARVEFLKRHVFALAERAGRRCDGGATAAPEAPFGGRHCCWLVVLRHGELMRGWSVLVGYGIVFLCKAGDECLLVVMEG